MKKSKLFEARNFGLVIGLFIFLVFVVLKDQLFLTNAQSFVRDVQMQMLNELHGISFQRGVKVFTQNPRVSPDIQIIGVDTNSLAQFGRWPWPRFRHADALNALARISDQNNRESSVMLDFFFLDPSLDAGSDFALQEGIKENGRAFLEGILMPRFDDSVLDEENLEAFFTLVEKHGSIQKIEGDIAAMPEFYGMSSPLTPFANASAGYGHATFLEGEDKVFRSQLLVAKVQILKDIMTLEDFLIRDKVMDNAESWVWFDEYNKQNIVPLDELAGDESKIADWIRQNSPPSVQDLDGDGTEETFHLIYQFQNIYVPSITLSLAANHFGVALNDIEVVLGKHVRIPRPTVFDPTTGTRKPFGKLRVGEDDLIIPIDRHGSMLINFVGRRSEEPGGDTQTFSVRSYLGYSRNIPKDPAQYPPSFGVPNAILMAGPFSTGMADDEKLTPVGMMYGVEVHANALNAMLMNRFVGVPPNWVSILVLLILVMLIAFLSSRFSPQLGLGLAFFMVVLYFMVTLYYFELTSVSLDFVQPSFAILLTMVSIVAYRVLTEEKEKKRIHGMFGKYVSPSVVEQLLQVGSDPELGGVDKDISVLFSDIRGFTTLSESMTPQELVNHLNVYLSAMTDIIHEYFGTLDKYVGDEIMCFWGAPLSQPDHALLACKCALKQMEKLHELNEQWPPEKRLDIGIGINSGTMTVGNMGSKGRMNYTLMGDNVNLGARLEGTNKQYLTHIIISEFTYELVKGKVIARELDNIRVKGKNKPVLIYELVDLV